MSDIDPRDRVWYVKYRTIMGGEMHCLQFGREPKGPHVIRSVEIPKEFNAFSLQDFINYFEHGIKPRRRIGYESKNHQGSAAQEG